MGTGNRLTDRINRRASGTWIVATIALFTGLLALAAPDPDHLPSLWVAHSRDTVKLEATTGQPLLALADGGKVRTLLVDPIGNRLWTYRNHRLHAYGFDGTPELMIQLPEEEHHRRHRDRDDDDDDDRERSDDESDDDDRDEADRGDDDKSDRGALALQPADGSLWLAVGDHLHRFDAEGALLGTLETRRRIRGIAADPENGWLWVAEDSQLTAYDGNGERQALIELNRRDKIRALTWSPSHQQLWVVLQRSIRRIDASGTSHFEHRVRNAGHPVTDGAGGLWFVTHKEVRHIDEAGLETLRLRPFGRRDQVIALASDPADGGVWAAAKRSLRKITVDGELGETITAAEGRRSPHILALAAYSDILPPTLEISAPEEDALLNDNRPVIELEAADGGIGVDRDTLALHADDAPLSVSCEGEEPALSCRPAEALPEGDTHLTATVEDYAGNRSETAERHLTIDTIPPQITVETPADGLITNQPEQLLSGVLDEPATLTLDGAPLAVDADHRFTAPLTLNEGPNPFALAATDAAGNGAAQSLLLHLDTHPPEVPEAGSVTFEADNGGRFTLTAPAGSVEPDATVTVANGDTVVTARADGEGAFTLEIPAVDGDTLSLTVTDAAGNISTALEIPLGDDSPSLPPDPSTIAPPLETADFASGVRFLFEGANPIQSGVAPGTIETRRAAVVRGRVLRRDGSPLPGVEITVKDHPELGRTLSRADGWFDLAVNGGGLLTLDYRRDGYLPAQRQLDTPWQDFAHAPEAVLLPLDSAATVIDLATATGIQVARGNPVSDADGQRQATLLVPPGTRATLTLPDGSQQPLDTLTVRATEYTVGENGPTAMPAPLPAASGYTYAVELSADEALAAGASRVTFDRPLPVYVDNFLGFPTGETVPAGWYDFERAAWLPSDDGRIIELLAANGGEGIEEEEEGGGMAVLDVDGSGQPAGPDALAELGITDEERTTLAALYPVGATLWRVPVEHFTPWDLNWPYGPPPDATAPPKTPPEPDDEDQPDPEDDCTQSGCIIQGLRQTLGEEIDLTGLPYGLHYRSDRVPGRRTSHTLTIPLSGSSIPASLQGITLTIRIAGQFFQRRFPAQPNQTFVWQWNGLDGFGRRVNDAATADIRVSYQYYLVYYSSLRGLFQSFARFADPQMQMIGRREGATIDLAWSWRKRLGSFVPEDSGLGGWTPGIHHAYVPTLGLFGGDGSVAGKGGSQYAIIESAYFKRGDDEGGGYLRAALGLAFDAGGNLYIADRDANQVWRVDADGNTQRIAGTGDGNYSGDGGPATEATLNSPRNLAIGVDGSVYIADSGNHCVRRVAADGTISTVAGSGVAGYFGDGGPAVEARLLSPSGVAVDSDGSLYIADTFSHRIRRVTPDGIITTAAGNGTFTPAEGDLGDGRPAVEAELAYPSDLAIGPDGGIFIVDTYHSRIRRVAPDGIISTVAGMGSGGESHDGMLATETHLNPTGIFVSSDGVLYISESTGKIRKVTPEGVVTTVAGTGELGNTGDGGLATRAQLYYPLDITLSPGGILYIADGEGRRIRTVSPSVPDIGLGDILSPNPDGTEFYHFDPDGHHLRTLDAITGAQLYAFAYTDDGLLHAITDRDGRVATIERTADGAPLAIVSPDGQRTTLATDAGGYLSAVTDPAGNTHHMAYTADGLMTAYTDPNGHQNHYTYDDRGRLTGDTDPLGGGWNLARDELDAGYQITMTSAEGRTTTYLQEPLTTGERQRTVLGPDGTTLVTHFGTDGVETTDRPDGAQTTRREEPDPRFGMITPLTVTETTTPGGLTHRLAVEREVELAAPNEPFSLTTLTETLTRNGRPVTDRYDATTRRWTTTTAEGRGATRDLDPLGRAVREQSDGLYPATYAYDAAGRLTGLTLGEAAEARHYALRYYADGPQTGFLEAITDPLGRNMGFNYDPAGRVTRQTLPDGREVQYGYDPNGNLTTLIPPGGHAHSFDYTAVNREAQYSPPSLDGIPAVTRYSYNLDKELTRVERPDGKEVALEYDAGGRLSAITTPRGQLRYSYDAVSGRLTTLTAPDGGALNFAYDGFLPLGEAWEGPISGIVAREYNDDFWVTSRAVNGDAVSYAYDADGMLVTAGDLTIERDPANGLVTATTLGSVVTERSYNGFGELESETVTVAGVPLLDTRYTRDPLGRIVSKNETLLGVSHADAYVYDPAGRLATVTRDGVELAAYLFDANGNRLNRITPTGVENGVYDSQDRVMSYDGVDYSYTENGELLSTNEAGAITNYDYDVLGNLLAVDLPNGSRIDYTVDGRNRRVGKRVNGTLVQGFLYRDRLNPIAELDGNGTVVARFVYGKKSNVPAYVIKGTSIFRVISDHLGSPRLVIDAADGTIAQRMDYDEFGNVTLDTNSGFQPFGYAGGLYDPHTGLIRHGARDYDPRTGRWTAKDPSRFEGGDTNLYRYAHGDPINYRDSNGENTVAAGAIAGGAIGGPIGAVVGAVVGATVGVAGYIVYSELDSDDGDYESAEDDSDGNTSQDKKLTPGEIKKLKDAGIDPEEEKGYNAGLDLFKDRKGNICVKPKNGKGDGDPIGININNL